MRNTKAYIWIGLTLVITVLLVASMFAPHGADPARTVGNTIHESYLNPEGEGILLPAGEN